MNITIIGAGYVGLVSGACFAELGHSVWIIEADREKVDRVNGNQINMFEPGLEGLLTKSLQNNLLKATQFDPEIVRSSEVIFLCVGTSGPSMDGRDDLSTDYLANACDEIAGALKGYEGDAITIVVKSTVPPGTTRTTVMHRFSGLDFVSVAMNPEFLREGVAIEDFMNPDRIIIGAEDEAASGVLEKLYASLDAPIIVTTPETAELVKLATNSFLACAISFSNEVANIAEATANVRAADLFAGLHLDKRFDGPDGERATITSYLKPSSGYGGSCLPKDTQGFGDYAHELGLEGELLAAIASVNLGRAEHIIELLERSCPDLRSTDIAVLGLAFKAGTNDLRHSPTLKLLEQLAPSGGRVRAYDPNVQDVGSAISVEIEVMASIGECLQGARAVLVLTDEATFKTMVWGNSGIAEGAIIYDPWGVVEKAHGHDIIRLGNGSEA